ncbi:MAG: long-chain fatty acid--CoA ligase [Deltaproteobacteria bacterium]|nr:long-chain fatty acid--CoA ligase [Deltaproteobacteria bacterium]MBT8467000.1 long-chain fatty acid--CoA ligase [Deltaproteobacteria bacterium]NND30869.1 long-chain fatty acid--CoA ligase [Myxococcales bacterium]NNK44832.1 long-chain fatty acid--CoA ligase [Myxococcales bacterium]
MTVNGTMLSRIEGWAKAHGNEPAIHDRSSDGTWATSTWSQYWESVRRVGKGLMALGLQPGDCVAIVGANRRDWVICQHGINAARGIPAPLYTTLLPEQMAYIVSNAESKIVICDDETQLNKYISIAGGDSPIEHIVTMDDLGSSDPRVITLEALMAKGDSISDAELDAGLDSVKGDDVALLIYTSGTTGLPKGAMLTHEGIDLIANAVAEVFPSLMQTKTRSVSYLPLCHAAEQGMTNFAGLMIQGETFYCSDLTQIKDYLVEVHPTIFLAVPRVWEKFEAALRGKLAEATGIKAKLASWARKTELEAFKQEVETGRPVSSFSRGLANKLVISKIKEALGLEQLQVALSGAAPISVSTLEFFASIGLPIHEGYGMTETTAFASVQPHGRPKLGTIGRPLPGVQAKIAEDGEIMLKGINMVKGYLRLPDKTAELYDSDGWMHTGDLGAIDEDGYISITGRKKDLIITAGGKNVAPAEMEGYLQSIPGVGQAVVVGDRQPYLSALIVLDPEALPELEVAAQLSGLSDVQSAARNEDVKRYIEQEMQEVCNKKVARYQTIKKIKILPSVFSVDGGELTPTLKVKRNIVNEKYAAEIAAFYGEAAPATQEARA